jgi:hypothetical protein
MDWEGETFDVSTAFLSGKETSRNVYVRAPKEGLPAVEGQKAIRPLAVLELLKGAYGLAEAPRLWYLRARELLLKCGFQELRICRSVFALRDKDEKLRGIITLHVDDGLIFGDPKERTYKDARRKINEHFNIKEWHRLDAPIKREDDEYLGACWNQDIKNHTITIDMNRYFGTIKPDIPPRGGDDTAELNAAQQKAFRSQVMKLSWPVRHVLPQLAYGVSYLTSKNNQATIGDWKQLYKLQTEALDLVSKNEACIVFRKLDMDNLLIVTSLDASFSKEEGMKSQCGFISVITENTILDQPTLCSIVEYQSTRITRVVKSTMAAESAALSLALDRQLYLRLMLEAILYGEPPMGPNWRHELKIPGILVTDARSLHDHINKTGSLPSERQTLIDLLIARDLTEAETIMVRWVPTTHQLADILTKSMKSPAILQKLLRKQLYCLIGDEAEQKEESRRADMRKGQRDRRKVRMKEIKTKTTTIRIKD